MMRIGVFDSGVGGLSVLKALWETIPYAHYIYYADSAYAPYGDKSDAYILERSAYICATLLEHQIDLLVIACNTATAHAAAHLRHLYPDLAIVAIEPALKPAAHISRNKCIGVMATASTVQSERFQALQAAIVQEHSASPIVFQVIACEGLALAIEQSFISGDRSQSEALALHFAAQFGPIDTLVLGCTHYPFVQTALERYFDAHSAHSVTIIEASSAVAQQAKRLLLQRGLVQLDAAPPSDSTVPSITLLSSADTALLRAAVQSVFPLSH